MPIPVTQIFNFLEQNETCCFDRHEIASAAFGLLRRSLRQIIFRLRDTETQAGLEISGQLRSLLSEWLTVPVPFNKDLNECLRDLLGIMEMVRARWGSDIATLYDTALHAADELQLSENPAREKLRSVILDLQSNSYSFKIFCHRHARPYFESLFEQGDSTVSEDTFLHSVREYREAAPFDALVKFGPLRSRGWGSAPDALLTAPRFHKLIQVVWSGCSDESDFGYDPAMPPVDSGPENRNGFVMSARIVHSSVKWDIHETRYGDDSGGSSGYTSEEDELLVFRAMNHFRDKRSAVLIHIIGDHGFLYPPHSQILSFDTDIDSDDAIDHRIPGQTLLEGMFIIMPRLGDVDLGTVQAEQGHYSQIWKERLVQEWQSDSADLIKRLRSAGLSHIHLSAAVQRWCDPPSTVIHAPQRLEHFKTVLSVLGLDSNEDEDKHVRTLPFWNSAWNEIRRSRGEAIHTGFQEHEIIEEELLTILKNLMHAIREQALKEAVFIQEIPTDSGIEGRFLFFKILGIEEGFSVPETELTSMA
jgi:hypothetical protein